MPDFARGADAVKKAIADQNKGGGKFTPFTPEIWWNDGDERFLLFLHRIDDMVTTDVISHIPDTKAVEARQPFSYSAIKKLLYQ